MYAPYIDYQIFGSHLGCHTGFPGDIIFWYEVAELQCDVNFNTCMLY